MKAIVGFEWISRFVVEVEPPIDFLCVESKLRAGGKGGNSLHLGGTRRILRGGRPTREGMSIAGSGVRQKEGMEEGGRAGFRHGRLKRPPGRRRSSPLAIVACLVLMMGAAGVRCTTTEKYMERRYRLEQVLRKVACESLGTDALGACDGTAKEGSPAVERLMEDMTKGGEFREELLELDKTVTEFAVLVGGMFDHLWTAMIKLAKDMETAVRISKGRMGSNETISVENCKDWTPSGQYMQVTNLSAAPRPKLEWCRLFFETEQLFKGLGNLAHVPRVRYGSMMGEKLTVGMGGNGTLQPVNRTEAISDEDKRDPRFRPWFVRAVTTRRDVVVIVDFKGLRVGIEELLSHQVTNTVLAVLGMLDYDDMVQMMVGGFTSPCLPGDRLVRATEANKGHMMSFVHELLTDKTSEEGGGDLESSTQRAWELFQSTNKYGQTNNCSRQVILITDGLISEEEADKVAVRFAERQQALAAQVFTIALSTSCSFCARITCGGAGLNIFVDPEVTAMSGISTLLSPIMQASAQMLSPAASSASPQDTTISSTDSLSVTPPIHEPRTGDLVISLAKAVFEYTPDGPRLHGVVALDVSLSSIWSAIRLLPKRPGTYTAVVYRTQSAGTLLSHPLSKRLSEAEGGGVEHLDLRLVENLQNEPALVRSMLGVVRGCSDVTVDRQRMRRQEGSNSRVYMTFFWGASVPRNITICWAPVPGTAFSAYLVVEPAPEGVGAKQALRVRSLQSAAALSRYVSNTSRLSGLIKPFDASMPQAVGGVPVAYHRTDMNDPYAGYKARRASIKLSYLSFVRQDDFLATGDVPALAEAVNRLMASGYEWEGIAAAPAGGVAQRPMSDMIFASMVAAAVWGDAQLPEGITAGLVGTPTGVQYETPARVIANKLYDVRDQSWYAFAKESPSLVSLSRPHKCSGGCPGGATLVTTMSKALRGGGANVTVSNVSWADVPSVPPVVMGVVAVNMPFSKFASLMQDSLGGECAAPAQCMLMDQLGFLIYHSSMSEGMAIPSSHQSELPDGVREEGVWLHIMNTEPLLTQELLRIGFLQKVTTLGSALPSTNGMYYQVDATQLDALGVMEGYLLYTPRAAYTISRLRGTTAFLLTLEPLAGQGILGARMFQCGQGSMRCPDVIAPWLPDLDAFVTGCSSSAKSLPPLSFQQTCTQSSEAILSGTSSSVASTTLVLRAVPDSKGRVTSCPSILDWLPTIIGAGVAFVVVLVVGILVWLWQRIKTAEIESEASTYRDVLQQPTKQIDLVLSHLAKEVSDVQSLSCSYGDLKHLIDHLERHLVNLLVLKNRCRLRLQSSRLQIVRDIIALLQADIHTLHVRMSRLEAGSTDYDEAEHLFPKFEARMVELSEKLKKIASQEMMNREATYINTADFYTAHHPDIFGDDLDMTEMADASEAAYTSQRSIAHVKALPAPGIPLGARDQGGGGPGGALSARTPRRAMAMLTPRLPEAAAGATEHKAQHFMRLAAQRSRDKENGLGSIWLGEGVGGVGGGEDAVGSVAKLRQHMDRIGATANAVRTHGVTMSERVRVLAKLDATGHVVEGAEFTDGVETDTGFNDDTYNDVLTTYVDDLTLQERRPRVIEESDEGEGESDEGEGDSATSLDATETQTEGNARRKSDEDEDDDEDDDEDEDEDEEGDEGDEDNEDNEGDEGDANDEDNEDDEDDETLIDPKTPSILHGLPPPPRGGGALQSSWSASADGDGDGNGEGEGAILVWSASPRGGRGSTPSAIPPGGRPLYSS